MLSLSSLTVAKAQINCAHPLETAGTLLLDPPPLLGPSVLLSCGPARLPRRRAQAFTIS